MARQKIEYDPVTGAEVSVEVESSEEPYEDHSDSRALLVAVNGAESGCSCEECVHLRVEALEDYPEKCSQVEQMARLIAQAAAAYNHCAASSEADTFRKVAEVFEEFLGDAGHSTAGAGWEDAFNYEE